MAIKIVKTEERIQPVTFLRDAKVNWLTLADRAMNATPWVRKNDTEGSPVAGQVVQAILMPLGKSTDALKALLREQFPLFQADKSETFGDVVKYVQKAETEFAGLLDVTDIGDGVQAIVGDLADAQKADGAIMLPVRAADTLVMRPSENAGEPVRFVDEFWRRQDAFHSLFHAAMEFGDPTARQKTIMTGLSEFSDWLKATLAQLPATKSDAPVDASPPGWFTAKTRAIKDRLLGRTSAQKAEPRAGNDTSNGGIEMEEKQVIDLVTAKGDALKAELPGLIANAVSEALKAERDNEEARKAEAAHKAEQDALKADVVALKEQLAQKGEAEKSEAETKDAEKADMKKAFADIVTAVQGLARKMDAIERSPGAPAGAKEDPTAQKGEPPLVSNPRRAHYKG